MMKIMRMGLVAAGMAAMLAVSAAGANSPAGAESKESGRGQRWMKTLELSPEQIALLRQHRLEFRKQMIKNRAEMQSLHAELADESTKDQPDMAKVQRIATQLGGMHAQMLVQRTKDVAYLRTILTPEQKQRFDQQVLSDDGSPWGKGRGHRGGPDEMDGPEDGEGAK